MSSLSLSNSHEQRLEERSVANAHGQIVSDRTYNMVLGLTVLWGLGINAIMCATMGDFAMSMNPIAFTIFYLVCCIAGLLIAYKSDNPLISFVGYNMVVIPLGLEIACIVAMVGGINTDIVMYAFVDTLLITGIMVIASLAFPNFFAKIGGLLFAGLIGVLVVSLITMLIGGSGIWISVICAVLARLRRGLRLVEPPIGVERPHEPVVGHVAQVPVREPRPERGDEQGGVGALDCVPRRPAALPPRPRKGLPETARLGWRASPSRGRRACSRP